MSTPLSDHARRCLTSLLDGPRPAQEINAGVCHKLTAEGFASYVTRPFPARYTTKHGRTCQHLVITTKGTEALKR